jgi:penicillin-binding protein 1A
VDDDVADIHAFPQRRTRVKKLRLLLVLGGLSLLALVSTVFGMMMALAADLPSLENRQEFKEARNSELVDVRGRPLGILTSPDNRVLVRSDQISPAVKHAVIAIEDRRFYEHDGVDPRGVARAFVQDVLQRRAVQGASTIPQQFVKNALQAQSDRTVFQKLRESALAFHLSRKWSKEKILTEYLNAIYFGNGAYGIESAARTYFGNEPAHRGCGTKKRPCADELEPYEAALLAGIIASPSAYDPVSRPAAAEKRRNLVLQRMLEQRLITRAEYDQGIQSTLPADISPPREQGKTKATPYFTTWVKQQIVDRYGPRRAFNGGLKIKTTIDLDLQRAAEATVKQWLGGGGPTAALVAIDNDTGEVRAMVGGTDYNKAPFNLATQGRRQPGSAFKPFVLATALKAGISPGSTWTSKKQEIHSKTYGCDFTVNNYEDAYSGVTTLANATTFSDNAVYAQVGLKVGLKKVAQTARRMGIRTPVSRNCAMTLGGLREGVTPLDMAHAYQTFATGGRLVTGTLGPDRGPVGIRSVCRMKRNSAECDEVIDRNRKKVKRVLPEDVARTTTEILSTVIARGTAVRARLDEFAAGKTGTTENYGDAWFVGFTKRMTVAVWVGYPNEFKPMETEYRGEPVAGGTYPAEIWRDFMKAVDRIIDERVNKERAKKGLPPRDEDEGEEPPAPGTPTTPASPATPQQQETPTPNGGAARPEQPQRTTPSSPGTGGAGGGGSGGQQPTQPPAQPAPAPATPAPQTPAPAPAPDSGAAAAPTD